LARLSQGYAPPGLTSYSCQTSGEYTTSTAPSLWRSRELELEHERMRVEARREVRRLQVKKPYTYKNSGEIESVEGTQMLDGVWTSPALSLLTQATEIVENEKFQVLRNFPVTSMMFLIY